MLLWVRPGRVHTADGGEQADSLLQTGATGTGHISHKFADEWIFFFLRDWGRMVNVSVAEPAHFVGS